MAEREKTVEQKVGEYVRANRLISAGDRLVVGVSGGADSVCLLHILARCREDLGVDLHVAHLNHMLRGTESDNDAAHVSGLAQKLGLPATIESRDVAAYQTSHNCSLEEAAREVRYRFLAEVADKTGAVAVAVGHTSDDHVETILLHWLRGTGIAGLRGLRPRSALNFAENGERIDVIRPLMETRRQETIHYCRRHRLSPRKDSSNESLSFLRNRIRLELLPVLRSYNPGIDKVLLRLAEIAVDDVSFIEEQAYLLWPGLAQQEGDAVYLEVNKILPLPPALQRQVFKMAVSQLRGDLKDVEADHIEAMMELLKKPAGKKFILTDGLTLTTEYGRLVVTATGTSTCPLPELSDSIALNIPGETKIAGWRVTGEVLSDSSGGDNGIIASFDLDKAGRKLEVRRRKPGDRFQPLGMRQIKKLQDFMVDAKIPRDWRDRVPLVSSGKQILWVVGYRIDDRVKVTDKTKQILRLRFERLA
ncbi:MAG TPA: tRNA lysidine(34) synthetase TilS [Dehalococcoidia bacterium]